MRADTRTSSAKSGLAREVVIARSYALLSAPPQTFERQRLGRGLTGRLLRPGGPNRKVTLTPRQPVRGKPLPPRGSPL